MNYFRGSPTSTLALASVPTLRSSSPSVDDFTRFVTDGLAQPVLDGLRQAAANFVDTISAFSANPGTATPRPLGRPQRSSDCCGSPSDKCCGSNTDTCHCKCCIVDADLVVYARLGERRVVPLSIENRWRRERDIEAELSAFTSRGGKASPITGRLLPPAPKFVLPPCGQVSLILVLESNAFDGAVIGTNDGQNRAVPDVDDCTVAYADLRVTGCDIRPLRIAVALLPRDCHDYAITCSCECC